MTRYKIDKNLAKTIPLMFMSSCKKFALQNLQAAKDKSGAFKFYTYKKVYDDVICFAKGLSLLGIKRGDNVALIADNRREWFICDYSILALGAADVPRGCDSQGNELRFIISFADCQYGIFENAAQLKKITCNIEETPLLKTVIIMNELSQEDKDYFAKYKFNLFSFAEVFEKGRDAFETDQVKVRTQIEQEMMSTQPDDIATIIFTSGTTGTPKGVMLTHKNYMEQMACLHSYLPTKPGQWWMSILPVWHSFERAFQYFPVCYGSGIAYSKPIGPVLMPDLAVIRPQWMCSVPRIWEALAKNINRQLITGESYTKRFFRFLIGSGKKWANARDKVCGRVLRVTKRSRLVDFVRGILPFLFWTPFHLVGEFVLYRTVRSKFGGRFKTGVSGGGALQKKTNDFYRAIGFPLIEAYGMTETAPIVTMGDVRHVRPGCVGFIIPTMEVKVVKQEHGQIVDDKPLPPGEKGLLLYKSVQNMKGYYKRPDLTEKVIDKDGFLNSGDLGLVTFDNEIKITGRCKDTIVLLDGENIEPAVIEAALKTSQYVESVIILGQDQRYLGALIVPVKDRLCEWAKGEGLDYTDYPLLCETTDVMDFFRNEVNSKVCVAEGFRNCEKVSRFALLPDSFKPGEELSAKGEMMRYKIEEKYAEVIKGLFS
ncbi:MAG: AMP-binding protein [Treponema sp.]|nr:AMP-binding protein [Treponema sp.]